MTYFANRYRRSRNDNRNASKNASHAFFQNYRIEIRKRIHIHYRIKEIDKKISDFCLFLLVSSASSQVTFLAKI